MKRKSKAPTSAVRSAARLRAAGWSWKAIAEKFGRRPETCARWPQRYRGLWDRAFQKAEAELLQDSASEGRVVLQRLLRAKDERVQSNAARMLFQARLAERRDSRKAKRAEEEMSPAITGVKSVDDVLKLILDYTRKVEPASGEP